jgi:hypothetical protein
LPFQAYAVKFAVTLSFARHQGNRAEGGNVAETSNTLTGSCHCGNIRYRLFTARQRDALPLRACRCSFCRRVGARYTSDPEGELRIAITDPAALSRYRFTSGVVAFLVCTRCGGMPAAVTEIDRRTHAVVNANTLDTPLDGEAPTVDFSGETPQEGEERRRRSWISRVTIVDGERLHE